MNTTGMIVQLVSACTSGQIRPADCGPVWHMGIIAGLVVALALTLLVMRLRDRPRTAKP